MAPDRKRISGSQRRGQILEAAISIMAEQGLEGTTTRRIAEKVGVSEPALYKYFPSKKELLLEALEVVGNVPLQLLAAAARGDEPVPERVLRICAAFYEFVMEHNEESLFLFEAVTGARDPDIREALGAKFMDYTLFFSEMLEAGKLEGSVREDLDAMVAAWQILSLGITLIFAALIGLEEVITREKALLAVEEILENIVGNASTGAGEPRSEGRV